jgi:hypothetical protein
VALIRTDVSEDRIASIFRVYECEQVTERSCKLLYRQRLVESQKMIIIIVTAVETSNLTSTATLRKLYNYQNKKKLNLIVLLSDGQNYLKKFIQ